MQKIIRVTDSDEYREISDSLLKYMEVSFNERNFETNLNLTSPLGWTRTAAMDIGLALWPGTLAPAKWRQQMRLQDNVFTFSVHNIDAFKWRMKVYDPPVDTQKFLLGDGTPDENLFLFIGDADDRTGIDLLLKGWAQSHLHKDGARLLLSCDENYDDLPDGVGLADSSLDKVDLLQKADFLVSPIRGEGCQCTTLQALSCGCNVIATKEPSLSCISKRTGVWPMKCERCEPSREWCDQHADGWLTFEWFYTKPKTVADTLKKAFDSKVPRDKCRKTAVIFDSEKIAQQIWSDLLV